ncbi:hypothetical protein ACFSC4_28840 [Deinococcus malanensis]|uniref:hypothetical protein n=1 Tax=Deinococcus malanensis TaxID=1706855 RepID=UPI00362B2F70
MRLALLSLTATALFACAGSPPPAGPITSYTLPGQTVYPEGITYNDAIKSFFVSSTSDGTIFRGNLDNPTAEVFLPPNPTERPTAIGLNTDNTGKLFIAGGRTGRMFVYDLNTKALQRAYTTPATPQGEPSSTMWPSLGTSRTSPTRFVPRSSAFPARRLPAVKRKRGWT